MQSSLAAVCPGALVARCTFGYVGTILETNCLTDGAHSIVLAKPVVVPIWVREHLDDEIVENATWIIETWSEVEE